MARFLLFSLLSCTQDGGEEENKKKVTHGVGVGNTKMSIVTSTSTQNTTRTTIWYTIISLFDCLFFFLVLLLCLRVLCRPLKVRQIDAKGPRIYQMELSDYLRYFSFFSRVLHRRIHPRCEQRSSYVSVPKN